MKTPALASTSRKQLIAQTALHLFSNKGYEHVSTQLIAKEAGVSEALIFKHFGTKEQLLAFIITTGYQRIVEHIRGRLAEENPLVFLHKMVDLPHELVSEEPEFWKLQARLTEVEFARKQHARFLQPLPALLQQAFQRLGYPQPEAEAQLLLLIVEALWKMQATGQDETMPALRQFIKTKYRHQQ
ncbi:TetR/AcrR family transcriptional regulator [Hymenobacter terricola]|uniref:TetR/AcrR family transcriptional regulator n=1 Tax=Hymenobacter terricola TaxID=2819236 RepID=UPI001B30BEAF|nr:TetR/AcrR family transcriptional regulator [Hymenobacter terricola]